MDERERMLKEREKALHEREKQLETREKALEESTKQGDGIYSKINVSLKVWNWVCVGLFSLLVVAIAVGIFRAL